MPELIEVKAKDLRVGDITVGTRGASFAITSVTLQGWFESTLVTLEREGQPDVEYVLGEQLVLIQERVQQ